jgi:hypothetical protein
MQDDQKCLREDSRCKGGLGVVSNPTTGRGFLMCDYHADLYLKEMDRIGHEYPEIYQPCPECGQVECVC